MMRKQLWCSAAVGFLAAALLAGCGQKTDAEVPSENKTEKTNPVSVTQVKEPEAVSAEDFERRSQVRENNPVSGEFVSAAQAFPTIRRPGSWRREQRTGTIPRCHFTMPWLWRLRGRRERRRRRCWRCWA